MKNVTFKKITTGEFDVLLNGEKTRYMIVNGSKGVSGFGQNMYGIVTPTKTTWVGTLQNAKKMVTFSLTKEAK